MIRRNIEVDGARDPTDDPTPRKKHKIPEITIELPDTPGEYFVEATVTSLDDPDYDPDLDDWLDPTEAPEAFSAKKPNLVAEFFIGLFWLAASVAFVTLAAIYLS